MARLGSALVSALHHREAERETSVTDAVLLHPRRARLFEFLCLHPAAVFTEAARATGTAAGTLRWHGSRLVDAGWLRPHASTYYPSDLVDPGDLGIFTALRTGVARRALASVFAAPGQSVSDLGRAAGLARQAATRLIDDFRSVGLVSVVEDGAFARVYATPVLGERRDANRPRARAFCAEVLRRLGADGMAPEVLRRTASEFLVRAGPPGHRISLDLAIDPFASAVVG